MLKEGTGGVGVLWSCNSEFLILPSSSCRTVGFFPGKPSPRCTYKEQQNNPRLFTNSTDQVSTEATIDINPFKFIVTHCTGISITHFPLT